jgi:tetratricopeptide (TPR) repeat protein
VDKYREAQAEFIKAIKVDPSHVWAHSNGAYVATSLGDHREGLILANRAKSLDPKAPTHQLRYAWSLLVAGKKSDARAILDEIVSRQPEWSANPTGGWGNRFILRQIGN